MDQRSTMCQRPRSTHSVQPKIGGDGQPRTKMDRGPPYTGERGKKEKTGVHPEFWVPGLGAMRPESALHVSQRPSVSEGWSTGPLVHERGNLRRVTVVLGHEGYEPPEGGYVDVSS